MKKFARIENNIAVETFSPENGFDIDDCFPADVVAMFHACQEDVTVGSFLNEDGSWIIAPETPPSKDIKEYPTVGPIHFKMLFTSPERLKAKELRATDPALDDFWGLIEDPRTDVVNLALSSVQDAVDYTLTAVKAAGVDVDVPVRKAAILSGVLV